MPLLFMDNGCQPQGLDSLSADECSSNTSGLEREGEEQQMGPKVAKRREKNRDAARKSRKKQTERADELHQELQCLEQSNAALRKEIAALKKNQQLYETALERHKPHCCLRSPASSSSTCPSASSSAQHKPSSSPPQASNSQAKSVSASAGPQTLKCTKETHFSPSTCGVTTTTAASPAASSAKLSSSSSSSSTFPYSVSFSSQAAPHSLFSQLPLSMPRSTSATPSCASRVSNLAPELLQNKTSVAQSPYFPGISFSPATPDLQATLSSLETSVPEQHPLVNPLQLSPYQLNNTNPSCAHLPRILSTSPHVCSDSHLTQAFSLRQSYDQQVSTHSPSILSLLTVPSQLNVTQPTSSSMDETLALPPPSLPPSASQLDPSKDLSLSEFLERNDWILSGISNE